MKAYDQDLRQKIISAYRNKEGTQAKTCETVPCKSQFCTNIIRTLFRYRKYKTIATQGREPSQNKARRLPSFPKSGRRK